MLCACQSSSQVKISIITVQNIFPDQINGGTVNYLSSMPAKLSGTWTAYTNANQVAEIAFDQAGNLWSVGRGGVTRWDITQGIYQTYTIANGLAENFQTAIVIAANGKIWVGSLSGYLSFYDGVAWGTVARKVGDTITDLAAASDGAIWIGTNQGIVRFDGLAWTSYTTANGILDNYVQSVFVASDGVVWLGLMGGVSYFDGMIWQPVRIQSGEAVTMVYETPDKKIWLNSGHSLIYFDGKTWIMVGARKDNDFGFISTMAVNAAGKLWVSSKKMGLVVLDEDAQHLTRFPIWDVTGLAFDGDDHLWLSQREDGVSRFDAGNVTSYRANDGPVDNLILSSGLGLDGSLWFGTSRGVSKYDGITWESYHAADGHVGDSVLAMAIASDGSMWFGTESGISRFDGMGWESYTKLDGLADNWVAGIAITPDEAVWAVTRNGLSRYENGNWFTFSVIGGLPAVGTRAITTWRDGSIWVSMMGGLTRFNYRENTWLSVYLPNNDSISCLSTSELGDLWIGTMDSGVLFLDHKIWDEYAVDDVQKIALLADGQMQITMYVQEQLVETQVKGESFWRFYTELDGLSTNQINDIAVEPNGNIWVATDDGVSLFRDGHWVNYLHMNNLGSNEVQTLVIDSQGTVWAGMPLGGLAQYTGGLDAVSR